MIVSIVAGAMGLAILDAVVSSSQRASNVGGWIETFANAVDAFLNPTRPVFASTSTTAASTSTTAPVQEVVDLTPAALQPTDSTQVALV